MLSTATVPAALAHPGAEARASGPEAARGAGAAARGEAGPELSAERGSHTADSGAVFSIEPRGPFSWSAAYDFFHHFRPIARHADESPELRTAFLLDRTFEPVAVALRWSDGDGTLVGELAGTSDVEAVRRQVARIFSLDIDGSDFPAVADRDPALRPAFDAFPGLRPVLFLSPYECAAWAVISQRISGQQAAAVQARLAREHGTRFEIGGGEAWAFPTPQQLLEVDSIAGLAAVKVERLHGVARAALEGRLDADELRDTGQERALAELRTIPGIGEFWSMGIYVRACGVADALPMEPLAIAALGTLHGLGERPDAADIARITDLHRPFRMWATFLLRVAASRGVIPGIAGREMAVRRAARARG